MTRVLVTGATGFIGRGTLAPLAARGYEIHAVTSRAAPAADSDQAHWHTADLLADGAAEDLVRKVGASHLLHLAWYAEPGAFWTSSQNLLWVRASLSLLRAFAEQGGQRAVLAGTCAEYEWSDRTRCVEASTPCAPATLYGASKHALQTIAERYAETVAMSLAWGRIFFVFGPGESPARLGGSVAQAVTSGVPALCSHGLQVRDFLYSEDLADAFVALLASDVQGAINLGSGQPTTVRDLVQALGAAAGRPELIKLGARPSSPGEPSVLTADVTRLQAEVGWRPAATLEQRAADTVAWWRTRLSDADPAQERA